MTAHAQAAGQCVAAPRAPAPGAATAASFELSDDPARLDLAIVHAWLAGQTHWARDIARATVERAFDHSLWIGAFAADRAPRQVGVARVVTDHATFAYVCDVFVEQSWRGRGVARHMVEHLLHHPQLAGLRRVVLRSRDARGLYERLGFAPLSAPELWMERPGRLPTTHAAAA